MNIKISLLTVRTVHTSHTVYFFDIEGKDIGIFIMEHVLFRVKKEDKNKHFEDKLTRADLCTLYATTYICQQEI